MVFEGIKQRISNIKEDRAYRKEVAVDLKIRDKFLKEQAKEQARRDFEDKRIQLLKERKQLFLEQEQKKYDPQVAALQDTRTKGQKVKEGLQKIGEKAQCVSGRITSDTGRISQEVNIPEVHQTSSKDDIFFGKHQQFDIAKNNLKIQKQQIAQKFNSGRGPGFHDIIGRGTGKGFSQVLGTTGSGKGFINMIGNKKSKGTAKDRLKRFL